MVTRHQLPGSQLLQPTAAATAVIMLDMPCCYLSCTLCITGMCIEQGLGHSVHCSVSKGTNFNDFINFNNFNNFNNLNNINNLQVY
jgi:hypothetical protein